ncbi:serine protease inhibitor dipetalogastin-like [Saccostrea echinata]|uniref:serine protease inhibitor dipetalogastin-like n=1 Tax=Saccostrea echinata TaxID=191078 RepID=UPI002A82A7E4|nr:serine protease inhibitor dipetalogastin-like [Saccostrea echinata]
MRRILLLLFFVSVAVVFAMRKRLAHCSLLLEQVCYLQGHDPQCGTNNFTFYNKCEFAQFHCKNPYIHLAHNGSCYANSHSHQMTHGQELVFELFCKTVTSHPCNDDFAEVCASDGHTYINHCFFETHRCLHPELTIVSESPCTTNPVG